VIHENSSTYGGPVVSSTSRSAGGRGKSQNIMISRHQLVRPKEHHLRGQKDGSKSEKILASRHQLRRPNSEIKLTKSCSVSNLVRTTQNESIMRSSYGSTGQSLKNLRNSSRSFTSASSSTKRNVSFDKVSIREYPRCVGDNPSVTTGPPMS